MKTLISFFTLIAITISAEASVRTEYKWPSIGGLAINNACATETTFKSLTDIKVCVETAVSERKACRYSGELETCRLLRLNDQPRVDENVTETTRCVKFGARSLEVSRVSSAMKCTKWSLTNEAGETDCLQYENVNNVMGKVFNVETYKNYGNADQGAEFIGYTAYEIPNCK